MNRRSVCIRATIFGCSKRSTALREKGNSLVIVEHDEETMRRADHIIDLGPGAGVHGGEVVAQGTLRDIEAARDFGDRPLPENAALSSDRGNRDDR